MLEHLNAVVAAASGVLALAGAIYALLTRERRKKGRLSWWRELRRDFRAGRDALVGRDPVVDSITGRELAPALPGIGQRMANVETALVTMADQGKRLSDLEIVVASHTVEIESLKAQALERVVTRAESTQALRTIEVAIQADPPADLPAGE